MSKLRRKLKRKKKESAPDPLLRKAVAYYHSRNWPAADAACRQILRRNPGDHQAMNLLSIILTHKPDLENAENYVRRAIRLKPNEPAYLSNLGLILKEQEKWEKSFDAFARAAEINPRDDETLYNLGTVYQALQDTNKAAEYYRRALAINPDHVQALSTLGNLLSRGQKSGDELREIIHKLEEILAKPGIQAKEQVYFELARVHDRLGNYEKVFDFLHQANRIVRETFRYDVKTEKKMLRSFADVFSQELLEEKKGCGSSDPSPIFIVGMPRSGTTLVEQILASHSQVEAGGELYYLNSVITKSAPLNLPFQVDIIKLPNYEQIRKVPQGDFTMMAESYLEATTPMRKGKKYLTDKMPHNFVHVGMIRILFPNCRVIHCNRDPMDNGLSLYMQHFKRLHPYMYSLTEIGEYYSGYFSLMQHWHRILPGFMYEVSYENLVKNPERETKKLLDFCGLQWEEACLRFYELKRFIRTASEGQVDQPIYSTSMGRWKRYENQLQPLRRVLEENGVLSR